MQNLCVVSEKSVLFQGFTVIPGKEQGPRAVFSIFIIFVFLFRIYSEIQRVSLMIYYQQNRFRKEKKCLERLRYYTSFRSNIKNSKRRIG